MNWKVTLLGLATLTFAIGYGLLLGNMFVAGLDDVGEIAGVIMGGGLLLSLAVGTWAMIEVQRFLGKRG